MTDRPVMAVVTPSGDVVLSAVVLAQVLAALRARLPARPVGVATERPSTALAAVVAALEAGALAQVQRERAARGVVAVPSLPASSTLPVWHMKERVMGVTDVAVVLGVSPQRVRVLAAEGVFEDALKHRCRSGKGRRAASIRWCMSEASVTAYREWLVA